MQWSSFTIKAGQLNADVVAKYGYNGETKVVGQIQYGA